VESSTGFNPNLKAWDLLFHNPYLKAKGFLFSFLASIKTIEGDDVNE